MIRWQRNNRREPVPFLTVLIWFFTLACVAGCTLELLRTW